MPEKEEALAAPLTRPEEINYNTAEVVRETIETIVKGSCMIKYKKTDVGFRYNSGRIKEIYVELGDIVEKGDLLISLDTEAMEYNISLQECSLQKAEMYYAKIKKLQDENGGMEYELEKALLDLEASRIQLEKLNTDLGRMHIYAPCPGTVTYLYPNIEKGMYVSVDQALLTISDSSNVLLEYSGEKTGFMSGMIVEVTYRGTKYEGEVVMTKYDAPQGSLASMTNTVLFRINGGEDTGIFERGDLASVRVVLDTAENVLVIPKKALMASAGETYVIILEDDMKKERYVKTGIESATHIEIKEGLKEGDLVILD